MFTLRPYQADACTAIFQKWHEFKRLLLVLPTGSGKTILFSKIVQRAHESGHRALILVHRDELAQQAMAKLKESTGLDCGLEKAASTAHDGFFNIVVGSVQTLCREKRLARYAKDHFTVIICDEAHHAISDSWQKVLQHFDNAFVLGCTATPDRGDARNLGQYFEDIADEYSLRDAVNDGWLCPIVAQTEPINIDLTGVRTTRGDFNDADLGSAIEPYLGQIADKMWEHAKDRKILVFLPLIDTSKKMNAILRQKGFASQHIDGTSPDRREILKDFHHNKYRVLCNAMLLTEGYDEPDLDAVIVLRPTKSRPLYSQMIGRGTRISPLKKNLLVLDFLWHSERHALCHPASLVAKTAKVAEQMQTIQEAKPGCPVGLGELETEAIASMTQDRERSLARYLHANRKRKAKTIDPVWFGLHLSDPEIVDYEPVMASDKLPATPKQIAMLEKHNFDSDSITRGYASKIIGQIIERSTQGYATVRQVKCLERFGLKDAFKLKFEEAKKLMDQCAASRWTKRFS